MLLVGHLEALIVEGISRFKINSHVGVSIAPLRDSISGYDVKAVFDRLVLKGMSESMKEADKAREVRPLDMATWDKREGADADVLLKIEYRFGIGALEKQKPLPAIMALVSVESLSDNRILMKDTWVAHSCEEQGYTIDDYAKDGCAIYKRCFEQMIEQFGRDLAGSLS